MRDNDKERQTETWRNSFRATFAWATRYTVQVFRILLIAPGGLRSERGMWQNSPLDPVALLSPHFQVIAMDQRNAGESSGPIESDHGWDTYTQDQLDLDDPFRV